MGYANAPCCLDCWEWMNGDRVPVRIVNPDTETCHWCRTTTRSGIYIRTEVPKEN